VTPNGFVIQFATPNGAVRAMMLNRFVAENLCRVLIEQGFGVQPSQGPAKTGH
jgi:hypothetical protein